MCTIIAHLANTICCITLRSQYTMLGIPPTCRRAGEYLPVAYTFGFSRAGPGPCSDAERVQRGWPTTIDCRERSIPFRPKELREFGVALGVEWDWNWQTTNKGSDETRRQTQTHAPSLVQHVSTLSPNKAASRIERQETRDRGIVHLQKYKQLTAPPIESQPQQLQCLSLSRPPPALAPRGAPPGETTTTQQGASEPQEDPVATPAARTSSGEVLSCGTWGVRDSREGYWRRGVGAMRIPLGSHQQLQQALLVGGIAGTGEAVKVRGSPSPAEGLKLGSGGMGLGEHTGSSGGGSSGSGSNVKKLDKDKGEETGDEGDDDGYDEDEEGGDDDDDGEVEDEDEVMSEIQTGLLVRRTESRSKSGLSSGSGFFGSMEMDCDGEKTDEDPEPDPETEEAPTTDTGEVGGSTTDDGATRETSVAPAAKPATATGVWKKAPPPPSAMPAGKVAKSSTRESDREKEWKDKAARDKIKMPPPPPMVKRAASTATKGGVRPPVKEGTTTSSRARAISNATSSHSTTTGLSRGTSVRKGMVTKEDGGAITAGVKPRNAADSKTQTKPSSSTTPPTTTAASTTMTRQMRTRSIAGGTPHTQTSSTSRQNGATTGTDSEDLTAANRRTGLVKRPRPQSMFLPPGTKSGTEKEADSGAPPSPTAAGPTSSRPRQPPASSKDSRKPSTRTPATSGATTQTTTTTTSSHRRNPSEAQPTTRPPRPEFTTLQKDYSTPTPIPKPAETTSTTTLLPDAPTLQKQTHLLQLLLLHNTAIQSFQSLHSSAHIILSARYQATVDLYNHVRTRLLSDARAADLAVLRKILEATPQVPPVGGVARWGTASGRRLSGSREHLATGDGRRRTLSGEMCSPVEERIQVLSESVKRVEGLLRKGGEVSRVRAGWEGWVERRKGGTEGREDGLPKQWHRDWATVKRKVEVAVDGVRDFWVAYQHVLSQSQSHLGGNGSAGEGAGAGGVERGGTLVRMVMGYLELGEDVVRELEEMKALEKLWVEEGRERMRRVVMGVMAEGLGARGSLWTVKLVNDGVRSRFVYIFGVVLSETKKANYMYMEVKTQTQL
ncbi:hypothetical protein BGX38DRAFT_1144001 [Terfezia claveryi]|nr:hypothetical protein BGX38DRAFT_1144001 [Terfezia claveryi]